MEDKYKLFVKQEEISEKIFNLEYSSHRPQNIDHTYRFHGVGPIDIHFCDNMTGHVVHVVTASYIHIDMMYAYSDRELKDMSRFEIPEPKYVEINIKSDRDANYISYDRMYTVVIKQPSDHNNMFIKNCVLNGVQVDIDGSISLDIAASL